MAAFVLVIFTAAWIQGEPASFMALAIGLIPCAFLLVPKVWSMAIVTFLGLPCCLGSSMYCDTSHIAGFPGTLLHVGHNWVWLIALYGLLRVALLAKSGKNG